MSMARHSENTSGIHTNQKYDFSELKTTTHSRHTACAKELPLKGNKSSSSCFSSPNLSKRRPHPRQQNSLLCNKLVGTNRGFSTVSSGRTSGSCHRLRGRTPLSRNTTSSCTDHIQRTPRISTSTTIPYAPEKSIIVAIVEGRGLARGEVGMASLDLRNPELLLSQFSDTQAYVKVLTKLQILEPIEIIVPNTALENDTGSRLVQQITDQYPDTTIATVQRKYFNEAKGIQYINHLCVPEYSSVEMEVATKYYCLAASAALLKYVEFIQNVLYAPHSLKIIFRGSENTALIDFATAKNLELLVNLCDPKSGHSLFGILHHTKTVGGSRFLRANILQPPCHQETIETRLNCVEELTENEELFFSLQAVLGWFMDIEHLLSLCIQIPKQENAHTAEQKITNIIYLKHTLELVEPLRAALDHSNNPLFRTYYESLKDERFQELLEMIQQVVHDDTRYQKGALNMRSQKCFAIKPNINGLLDVARRMYTESMDDVVEMIHQLGEKHNLPLKISYNMLKGLYIQLCCDRRPNITVKHLHPVFIKVVKKKNTLSFTTEDLIKMNDRIRESLNEIYLMSNVIMSELLTKIREHVGCLYKLAEAVSSLDFLVSLAHQCTVSTYVRPELTDTTAIKNGHHPILEKIQIDSFVPNNTFISKNNNFLVITGPNMSGKSTYLKQVALLQIMAQIGCFVPAEYASFRITRQIFSRIRSNDDIESNCSTFMLEMREINYIIQNADGSSLIIIDELGRGTSVEEGIGLCYSICEYLVNKKAFTLFATHFLELISLDVVYPNVSNYQFEVKHQENGTKVNFTHTLMRGHTTEEHYGLKLAELSSLPYSVTTEARVLSEQILRQRQTVCQESPEAVRQRCVFRLAINLQQVASNFRMDVCTLKTYLASLREQYKQKLHPNREE